MASNRNPPSIDPAYEGSLGGILTFFLQKYLQSNVNQMLPAQVIAYDRTENRVQVQFLISIVSTGNIEYPRPQLASIPVFQIGGGNLMLNFPLKPGDLGWVLTNDRDISLFLQTYTQQPPNTARMFNFSDGVFFPDVMRNMTINEEDDDAVVLSTTDGTIRVAVSPTTGVTITSPTLPITLDGNVVVTGGLDAQGGLTGSGGSGSNPFFITGNVFVVGNINASGTITPDVPPP